jgi:MFS family permease
MNANELLSTDEKKPWWRLLNGYHWFVFVLAACGWMFDTMDQQIFTISRSITMKDLLPDYDSIMQIKYGGYATSIFMIGWATGGLIFGMLGDRWGRAKTMALTILCYSLCTGLSGLARSWEMFAIFRFLTGAGVGGEFAVGASLVAEVMPDKARPQALGLLQALSAVGNIIGAKMLGVVVPETGGLGWGWRGLYFIGALPALIGAFVFLKLREPDKWLKARELARQSKSSSSGLGKINELFTIPRWRKNTIVGVSLAVAGVLGLWGVGFYAPELIDSAIPAADQKTVKAVETVLATKNHDDLENLVKTLDPNVQKTILNFYSRAFPKDKATADEVFKKLNDTAVKDGILKIAKKAITEDEKTKLKSNGAVLQQIGAFFGMYCFSLVAGRIGRRLSFLLALMLGWVIVLITFGLFSEPWQVWFLWPMLGFGTLAPFGGYAIYFPELFPTRLRSTGTSFCYNVGRYIAALGPFILGPLAQALHGKFMLPGFRIAAMIISCAYVIGMVSLIWAPETANQPLPEDQ